MPKHRLLLSEHSLQGYSTGQILPLGREWSRHAIQVLRMQLGETLEICGSEGSRWEVEITSASKDSMEVRLLSSLPQLPPPFPVYLAQGLTKGDKFDLILRMGTELGVSGFFPFVSARCVSRPDQKRLHKRLERWRKIVREAARQSQQSRIPEVHSSCSLQALNDSLPEGVEKLVLYEGEQEMTLQKWVEDHPSPRGIVFLVGPEGGFEEKEINVLQQQGFVSVGLGPRILRTETAGPAVAAILQFQYDSFSNPEDGAA